MLGKEFVPRNPMFLEDGVPRLNVSIESATKTVGQEIGRTICGFFKKGCPIKEICLYGGFRSGKTSLANAILEGFDGLEIGGFKRLARFERIVCSYPKCRHVDYSLYIKNPFARMTLPEYQKPELAEDEILIGEWCDALTDEYLFEDRLGIEMVNSSSIEGALTKNSYFFPSAVRTKTLPDAALIASKVRIMSVVGRGRGSEVLAELLNGSTFKKFALPM